MIILHGGDVDMSGTWSNVPGTGHSGAECPVCQIPIAIVDAEQRALSIMGELSGESPDQRNKLNAFIEQLRESVAKTEANVQRENFMQFFKRCYTSDGDDILQKALQDAASAGDYFSPFHDAIIVSRCDDPQPMAFPLIRLCFLLWDVHNAIKRKTSPTINVLLWEANRALGTSNPLIQWEDVEDAATLEDSKIFPLIHCFTMLVSQEFARRNLTGPWMREARLELARKLACESIGPHFEGKPSTQWLESWRLLSTR
jgi:hypothetical protein